MSLVETAVIRRALFVITTDCEEGNKKMFLTIKEKIEAKTIDLNRSLLSPPPDPPHLGKSLKASFTTWLLKLFDERGCLSRLHTLRNKSGEEEMTAMRKLVPRKDHVKNKDRQDSAAVLKVSSTGFTGYLKEIGTLVSLATQ